MTTALTLVTDAMERIGALAGGEVPNATDSQRVLRALNDLLETWGVQRLNVWSLTKESLSLTGAQSYTIGQDGSPDFNTVRPLKLDQSTYFTVGGQDFPVSILTRDEYMAYPLKSTQGYTLEGIYLDDAYPNATLYTYPCVTGTLNLSSWKPLSAISTLQTTLSFPPGYKRALELSLAEDIASLFDLPMPQNLARQAKNARRAIRNLNAPDTTMSLPAELQRRVRFNILTGQ